MEQIKFNAIKALLDKELNKLLKKEKIIIKLGLDLYREFRSRELLEPVEIKIFSDDWIELTYRDFFVKEAIDIDGDEFLLVGPGVE